MNSTSLQARAWQFDTERGWNRFLSLVAHEFFHLWNVKRIHDVALGPFDYKKENYTRLLWVHEGWTSYYADRLLVLAGLASADDQRKKLASLINGYFRRPGRRIQPLSAASFDSWIKFYQTNQSTSNSTVNYYRHGATAALCLDLIVRHHSGNDRSLDDCMRYLNDQFARQGKGISPPDVRAVLKRYGGPETDRFWQQHVDGVADIPFAKYLAYAGLDLEAEKTPGDNGNGTEKDKRPKPWEYENNAEVGFSIRTDGARVFVGTVRRGSNAWADHLAIGDELVALGDTRITAGNWSKLLALRQPGDSLELLIARDGKLIRRTLHLAEKPPKLQLKKHKSADALEQRIYQSLFGEPFEKQGKAEDEEQTE